MPEKKNNKNTKINTKTSLKSNSSLDIIVECAAFFAVIAIGIALIFAVSFQGTYIVYNAFKIIADALAYIVAIVLAAFWVKRQQHVAWLVAYIVAVVVVVVLYIIATVNLF